MEALENAESSSDAHCRGLALPECHPVAQKALVISFRARVECHHRDAVSSHLESHAYHEDTFVEGEADQTTERHPEDM
jgi:hypothetical protein